MKEIKENWQSHLSTIIGGVMAIANAWITIDWSTFDINKEYPKLILSGLMAIGGYMTKINSKVNP